MLWKPDPDAEAARKHPDWKQFHREAGKLGVFFDHIRRESRTKFGCVAFTTRPSDAGGWNSFHLADGTGRTVMESLDDAWRKCGVASVVVDGLADRLCGRVVEAEAEDFESLFD